MVGFDVTQCFKLEPRRVRNLAITLGLDLEAQLIKHALAEVLEDAPENAVYGVDARFVGESHVPIVGYPASVRCPGVGRRI
jgi:hypothetical protein